MRNYNDNVMGQVMSKIFAHHSETDTCYTLTDAEKVFEAITDKYNGQFNLKYSTPSQISAFQCYIGIDLDLSKPEGMPLDLKLHTYSFTAKYINMAKA